MFSRERDLKLQVEQQRNLLQTQKKNFLYQISSLEKRLAASVSSTKEAERKLASTQAETLSLVNNDGSAISSFLRSKLDGVVQALRLFDPEAYAIVQPYVNFVESKDERDAETEKLKRELMVLRAKRRKEERTASDGKSTMTLKSIMDEEGSFNARRMSKEDSGNFTQESSEMYCLKQELKDAKEAAQKAKTELNRLVTHNLRMSASRTRVSKTETLRPGTGGSAKGGGSVPVVCFPAENMNSVESTGLSLMPHMPTLQHNLHVQKSSRTLAVREKMVAKIAQRVFSDTGNFNFGVFQNPPLESAASSPTHEEKPGNGYRLCVGAFCSDINILLQNFSEKKKILNEEQQRLMDTLLSFVGLGRPPPEKPAISSRELAELNLNSFHPVFTSDKVSRLLASVEGDSRYESDIEILRNTWDGLLAYFEQHICSQKNFLGIFMDSLHKLMKQPQDGYQVPEAQEPDLSINFPNEFLGVLPRVSVTHRSAPHRRISVKF